MPTPKCTDIKQLFPLCTNALFAATSQILYICCEQKLSAAQRIMPMRVQALDYGVVRAFESCDKYTIVLTDTYLLALANDGVRRLKQLSRSSTTCI